MVDNVNLQGQRAMRGRIRFFGWFPLVCGSMGALSAQPPTSASGGAPIVQSIKLIPWVELNKATPANVDSVVAGLVQWRVVTDRAFVSVVPGNASVYHELKKRVPDMRILPGLKTNDLLSQFDDVDGWGRIGKEMTAILSGSGEDHIVLENESAIRAYLEGKQPIHLPELRKGLQSLPPNVHVIWYPSIVGESEEMQARAAAVCRIAVEVLSVRFVDLSASGPKTLQSKWARLAKQQLSLISDRPVVPMLYFYGPGSRWWQDDQIGGALAAATTDFRDSVKQDALAEHWIILYPGAKRWHEAAASIAAELAEAAALASPRPKKP